MPKTTKKVARKTAVPIKGTARKKTAAKKKTASAKKAPVKKRVTGGREGVRGKSRSKSPKATKNTPTSAARKTSATKKKAGARVAVKRGSAAPGGVSPYRKRKGEKYMGRRQLEHFRKLMIAWKKDLMQEVDRTVIHMKADSSNYADSADRATQEESFSLELRERDRERKLIRKIEEALIRIDNSEYGYCELCGIEIGISRLEARPTATMCIDCKTLEEIKEKQVASI